MSKGVLTVVSGFSGAGKGTVMKRLIQKYDDYALSISVTTRKPREGERDGIEYFFKTKEEVETMIENDEFLEYARYVDNYYGTPRFYVEEMLAKGKNVILEIEIQGAMQIKGCSGICYTTEFRRTPQSSCRARYRNCRRD